MCLKTEWCQNMNLDVCIVEYLWKESERQRQGEEEKRQTEGELLGRSYWIVGEQKLTDGIKGGRDERRRIVHSGDEEEKESSRSSKTMA